MKVHTLDIDSSERDPILYPDPSSYVISLKNPIYDVSKISLISAKIPNSQLLVHSRNKTFSVSGNTVTLDETNYASVGDLVTDLTTKLDDTVAPAIQTIAYDTDTNTITFSNVNAGTAPDKSFTFEFNSGTNGYTSNTEPNTTPHQLLGFAGRDYTSSGTPNSIKSGSINLNGPTSLIVRLSTGSDDFTRTVYTTTPFYTGRVILSGDTLVHKGIDDPLTHSFVGGSQKTIRDIKVEFFYMSHGRLIPYDFRNQDHVMKFEVTCSTDKFENLSKQQTPLSRFELPPPISIPEMENPYRWKEYLSIVGIVLLGLVVILITTKPRSQIAVKLPPVAPKLTG